MAQFDGRAIVGERTGYALDRVPSRMESFREFGERHPDGLVLVPSDPTYRDYGRKPYLGYDSSAMPFLYRGDYDGPGTPLMRVVAVPGRDEAWSFDFGDCAAGAVRPRPASTFARATISAVAGRSR